jgi:hypothetical protein
MRHVSYRVHCAQGAQGAHKQGTTTTPPAPMSGETQRPSSSSLWASAEAYCAPRTYRCGFFRAARSTPSRYSRAHHMYRPHAVCRMPYAIGHVPYPGYVCCMLCAAFCCVPRFECSVYYTRTLLCITLLTKLTPEKVFGIKVGVKGGKNVHYFCPDKNCLSISSSAAGMWSQSHLEGARADKSQPHINSATGNRPWIS